MAVTAAAVAAVMILGMRAPRAEEDGAPPADLSLDPDAVQSADRHQPFTPYATDDGTVAYEDHRVGPPTDDDDVRPSREAVDDAQAFAEQNGYDVHQAWSAYSRLRAAQARIRAAEYESGTAGLGDVGVP
jgi:hypothetical protein